MRMKLHKSTRIGDYEIYPIYDIDFSGIVAETGYTSEYSNDAVGTNAYKYRQWKSINNNLLNYVPLSIMPKIETANGNIIPFWHRYNNVVDGRYTMPQENLASYAAVQQGVRPDDWGTNPNYIELIRETVLSHNIIRPYLNRTISTWSSSTSYYEDTKRTELRMFYTDTGCSFSVVKTSYSRGDGYYIWPRTYAVGLYPHPNMPVRFPANYAYTNPSGQVIDDDYYINDTISVINPDTGYGDWNNYTDGYNCQMVFVHFKDSGTDFYGVAIVQMSDFTENSYPVAIHVSAWDATFWGDSIISGGESGAGKWGYNSIPTISDGTFSGRSDSVTRDSSDVNSAESITTATNNSLMQLYSSGGVVRIYRITRGSYNHEYALYLNRCLYSDTFWGTRWDNRYFNPMSAVLNYGFLPRDFTDVETDMPIDRIILAGEDVSQIIHDETPGIVAVPTFNTYRPLVHKIFPEVNLENYFDGWADFAPYTKAILHLPFIGKIQLNINEIAHGSLGVEYICDRTNGNVIAYIWAKNSSGSDGEEISQYIATANGNCMYTIPIFARSSDYGRLLSGAIEVGAGVVTKSPTTLLKGASDIISGAVAPPDVSSSGQLGGNNVLMSPREVWLEIIRPHWVQNAYYQRLKGIPAEMSNCLADQSQDPDSPSGIPYDGFIKISHIELDGVNCTESERSEIASLLSAGVYIRGEELLQ